MARTEPLSKADVHNLKRAFSVYDNGDGCMDKKHLRTVMESRNIATEAAELVLGAAPSTGQDKVPIHGFFDWLFDFLKPGDDDGVAYVGTLNLLGNSYNAFEFMSADLEWQRMYSELREALRSITTEEVVQAATDLGFTLPPGLLPGKFEANLTKEFLKQDNHVDQETRFGMIGGNMVKDDKGQPRFQSVANWRALMQFHKKTYDKHPELMAYDLAGNLTAMKAHEAFIRLCDESYLNPALMEKEVAMVLEPIPDGAAHLVIQGTQEYPTDGTHKYDIMQAMLDKKNLKVVREQGDTSVAAILSKHLTVERVQSCPIGSTISELAQNLQTSIDEKDGRIMETTAKKTLVVDVAASGKQPAFRLVVAHGKEPKTETGTTLMAKYLHHVAKTDDRAALVVIDSNCPNEHMSEIFSNALSRDGFTVLCPAGSYVTTRKKRSELHGQICDSNKCLKVVEAHKDFIMLLPNGQKCAALGNALCEPNLMRDTNLLLPNARWPADHALVSGHVRLG